MVFKIRLILIFSNKKNRNLILYFENSQKKTDFGLFSIHRF
jgi:hypothetical protein